MLATYGQRTTPARLGQMAVVRSTRGHEIIPMVLMAPWSNVERDYVIVALCAIRNAQDSSEREMKARRAHD
jgi:hypothetical protein